MDKFSGFEIEYGQFGEKIDVAGTYSNPFGRAQSTVKTLPEQLAEILIAKIINGSFAPGQRLYETRLAEEFSVSRGPVREALRLLEREGLVTIPSRRGASVAKLTRKRLENIFSVRAALMGICAEDLARRNDASVQAVLDEGTRRLFTAHSKNDVEEFIIIVYQLSMYIAEASDNEIAKTVLLSLGRQTLPVSRQVFEDAEHRFVWATDWQAIVEAIRASDPDLARRAVRSLLSHIKKAAVDVYMQQQSQRVKKKKDG